MRHLSSFFAFFLSLFLSSPAIARLLSVYTEHCAVVEAPLHKGTMRIERGASTQLILSETRLLACTEILHPHTDVPNDVLYHFFHASTHHLLPASMVF
jgi:hypothetical protein